MNALPPYGPPGSEAGRLYMRRYMAQRRLRLRLHGLQPRIQRSGHCSNCGHVWIAGGRCPLCAIEANPSWHASRGFFRVRRWIAWMQLMEAIADSSRGPHTAEVSAWVVANPNRAANMGAAVYPYADAVLSELSA